MREKRRRWRRRAKKEKIWKRRRHADHANQESASLGRSCPSKSDLATTLRYPTSQASYLCALMSWSASPHALVPRRLHLLFQWVIQTTNLNLLHRSQQTLMLPVESARTVSRSQPQNTMRVTVAKMRMSLLRATDQRTDLTSTPCNTSVRLLWPTSRSATPLVPMLLASCQRTTMI